MTRRTPLHLVRALASAVALSLVLALAAGATTAAHADDASDAAAAAEKATQDTAKKSASLFDDFLGGLKTNLGANLFATGFNFLLGLAFPGPNYQQELQNIEQTVTAGFSQTNAELTSLQNSVNTLQSQVTSVQAIAASGNCNIVASEANGYVTTIQTAFDNYVSASNPAWLTDNLTGQSGTGVLRVVGDEIFGTGSGNPPFLSGLNQVAQATESLAGLLTTNPSGQGGLVATCAEAVASNIVTQSAASGTPASVGTLETQYFQQLQQITSHYASWVNIGAAISIQGGQMASMMATPTPPDTYQQAATYCADALPSPSGLTTPNLLTCSGIQTFAASMDSAVDQAWTLTGVGWGQATNGTIQTALRQGGNGYFADGDVPWLTDLSYYASGSIYNPKQQTTASGGTAVPSSDPRAVDLTGYTTTQQAPLKQTTWQGLAFAPATTSQWDALLGLDDAVFYQGQDSSGSFNACLSQNNSAYSCVDPDGQLLNRVAASGLKVNGSSVGPGYILYTGESSTWDTASDSSLPAAVAYYNNDNYPQGVPNAQVATFLDTSAQMTAGRSVAINPPQAEQGDITVGDMYPFAGNANGVGNTMQMPVPAVFAAYGGATSNGTRSAGVDCEDGSYSNGISGQTLMQFLGSSSVPNSASSDTAGSLNTLVVNGSSVTLYCGGQAWDAPSGTENMPPLQTTDSTFYGTPFLTFAFSAGENVTNGSGANMGMYLCSDFPADAFQQGNRFTTSNCPQQNPWASNDSASGEGLTTQPGWMVSAGSGAAVDPSIKYGWPVVDVSTSCTPTGITQGPDGNLGVPVVCTEYSQPYLAAAFGVNTGPVSVQAASNIGNGSSEQMTVALVNSGVTAVAGSVGVSFTSGSGSVTPAKGSTPTVSSNSNANCSVKGNNVTCRNITLQPGVTEVTVPVTGTSGSAEVLFDGTASSGAGVYASTEATLQQGPTPADMVPDLVTGVRAVASGTSNTEVTLSWIEPVSTTPITAYRISYRAPDGGSGSRTVSAADVTTVQGVVSVTTNLPEPGFWTVGVAAVNSGGTGRAGTTSVMLGNGPPPPPRNLKAREVSNGQVILTWNPIAASPPLDSYVITSLSPSGVSTQLDATASASYRTPALPETGIWTFAVAARNAAGTSSSSTIRINVQGSVPGPVEALTARATSAGTVDVSWLAPARAVPSPTSYKVTLFAPGSANPPAVASYTLPVTGTSGTVNIPAAYQLGTNSPTGVWTVVVQATNATGAGQSARSSVVVTKGLLNLMAAEQALIQDLQDVPIALQDIEAIECAAGLVEAQTAITGTCSNRTFTPNASQAAVLPSQALVVTQCSGPAPCPNVSGSVIGTTAYLTVTQNSTKSSLNITNVTTGTMVWSTGGAPVSPNSSVPVQLGSLTVGSSSYRLSSATNDVYFTLNVSGP